MQLTILLILITLISSCHDQVEETVVIHSIWSDPIPKLALETLAAGFEQENPGIDVQINIFNDYDFKKNIEEWVASPTPPDLLTWVAGKRTEEMAAFSAPLDHIFEKAPFQDIFQKKFLAPSSVKERIHFIPQSWYWWAIYYKPSIFKKLGISEVPQTWEQFIEICEKIKRQGTVPLVLGVKEDNWTIGGWFDYLNIRKNGGNFHKEFLAGRIPFTDPKLRDAMMVLPSLLKTGYLNPDFGQIGYEESAARLFNGQAAMVFLGEFIQDLTPMEQKSDLAFFAFPQWSDNRNNEDMAWEDAPLDGYIKMKNSPHPKAADKFLQYIIRTENQKSWAQKLGRVAANKNVETPELMTRQGIKIVQSATGVFQFIDRDTPVKFGFPFLDLYISLLKGNRPVEAVFEEMESLRQGTFSPAKP